MAAVEAAALDGLAEELLGQGEERRDEEKDGGGPENVDINCSVELYAAGSIGDISLFWVPLTVIGSGT